MSEELSFESAPADVQLWGVYGPECFPTVFAYKLRDYSDCGRAIWGFSVYRRQAGFRTLGTGKDWAEKNQLRLFRTRQSAFDHIAAYFPGDRAKALGEQNTKTDGGGA